MAKRRARANGEGTVYKRTRNNRVKWYAELVVGWDEQGKKKVLRSPGCDKKSEASAWLTERLAERNNNALVEPSRLTVEAHIESWLTTVAVHQLSPSTIRMYRNVFEWYIKPAIGDTSLQQLTPQQIQTLCHELSTGEANDGKAVSPRTIQITLTVLRRTLQQALEWNLIIRNPVDAVQPPKVPRKEMKVLTPEQFAAFIEAAQEERLHALFVLAVTSGLRQGELLALQWKDVDLKKKTVSIQRTRKTILDDNGTEKEVSGKPKTEAAIRTVPLANVAVESLKRWKVEQIDELRVLGYWRPINDLVFTSETNTPLQRRNLRDRGFRRICEAIGLAERRPLQSKRKDGTVTRVVPLLRFHDLRHTAITFMLSEGVKPEIVQKVAGHSDVTTTLRVYRHVFEEEKKEAAQVVDDFLKAAHKKAE